jgi:hypothetical protein
MTEIIEDLKEIWRELVEMNVSTPGFERRRIHPSAICDIYLAISITLLV